MAPNNVDVPMTKGLVDRSRRLEKLVANAVGGAPIFGCARPAPAERRAAMQSAPIASR